MRFAVIIVFFISLMSVQAQRERVSDRGILFVWNDTPMVQTITSGDLMTLDGLPQKQVHEIPVDDINVYQWQDSPLTTVPNDKYGFYQGFWSNNKTRFVYGLIQQDTGRYRVMLWEDGATRELLAGKVNDKQGYLLPLMWHVNGNLVLIERHMLHNLNHMRLYQLASDGTVTPSDERNIPQLKGNSVTFGNEWVFLGFDTLGAQGYIYNISRAIFQRFNTQFVLEDPPRSVFEIYPVQVYGLAEVDAVLAWREAFVPTENAISYSNIPFLHYPLPDETRNITCYPDSAWTALTFGITCAGLQTPRPYDGHEGVDVGGRPAGLPITTPVYASAAGIVLKIFAMCASGDVSCGDAYGNFVLMEHTRLRDGNAETWFTGYAHLDTILVQPFSYIHELGVPIALSGDTGLGGAHLHFEVRSPAQPTATNWIDPFDNRAQVGGMSLWLEGNERPLSTASAFDAPILYTCTSPPDNNIRRGAGTDYEIVEKTIAQTSYDVIQTITVDDPRAAGEWLHIHWGEDKRGWIWADLINCP